MESNREEGANQAANFTAKRGEAFAVNEAAKWLRAAQVAQLEGISKRAVQSRCKRGLYRSRRVQTPQGEAWEVDASSLKAGAKQPANEEEQSREPFTAKHGEEGANFTANAAPDFAGRYIERLESENAFLRSQVEEGNRNAAELRAALREALKATPRQLEQGAKSPETAPERPPVAAPPKDTPDAQTPAKSPGNAKEPRPLWKLLLGIR